MSKIIITIPNVCVHASPQHIKPIALIVLAEPAMLALAAANGISSEDGVKGLLRNTRFQDLVLKDVQAARKRGGLVGIEIISGVVIVQEKWTPQNGLLTSAMKLLRRGTLAEHKKDIDEAYRLNPQL